MNHLFKGLICDELVELLWLVVGVVLVLGLVVGLAHLHHRRQLAVGFHRL